MCTFFSEKICLKKVFPLIFAVPKTGKVLKMNRFGLVVQLVRMPPCHGGGRGFESRPVRKSLSFEAFLLRDRTKKSL
jgi:hypothetical protein